MKHANKVKRLEARQNNFDKSSVIQSELTKHPGSFTRPGSLKK